MSHACHRFWKCYKILTFAQFHAPATEKRHLNLQKLSEHVVRLTFWLGNVLRATTACTFSTSQLLKVVRDRQLLTLLTWKCASALASLLFDPAEPQIIGKTQWIATCSAFSRTCIFFLLTLSLDSFSSLIFSLLLFSSLTLPTSAFPSIGSLTSKLPSTICMLLIYIYVCVSMSICMYIYMQ